MGEVGVHLHHVAGAVVERVAKAGEVGRADAVLLGAVEHLAPSRARAARRSAISPVPSGEPSSTTSTRKPSGAAPREHLAGRGDDRLDVLGLVVGGQDQPGLAGHGSAYPRACRRARATACRAPPTGQRGPRTLRDVRELSNAAIADALEELGDLYELDGAIVHRVLAYRTAAKAVREASVSVAALARAGPRDRAAGDRQDAAGEDRRAARDRHDPRGGEAAREVPARPDRDHAPAGPGPEARAAAVLGARDRLARGAARGGAGAAAAHRARASAPKFEAERARGARPRRPAGRARGARGCCCRARSSSARRSPPACSNRRGPGTHVQLAGSARRMADSVKDIDLIAATTEPDDAGRSGSQASTEIERVSSSGERRRQGAHARGRRRRPADRRRPAQLGNLLQHFTGSGRAQRRPARGGGAARPARLRVRDARRRERRDHDLRLPSEPRSTSCSASPTSSPSCARTAASWRRPRAPAACRR